MAAQGGRRRRARVRSTWTPETISLGAAKKVTSATCRNLPTGGSLRGCAKTEITVRDGPYRRLRPQLADFAANECPRGAYGEGPCRARGHSTRSAAEADDFL
jgi:hypothetical protein